MKSVNTLIAVLAAGALTFLLTSETSGTEWPAAKGMRVRVTTGSSVESAAAATLDTRADGGDRTGDGGEAASVAPEEGEGRGSGRREPRLRPHHAYTGTVLDVDERGLLLASPHHPDGFRIPRSAIEKLQVSQGRRAGAGAKRGAIAGAVLLGVAGGVYGSVLGHGLSGGRADQAVEGTALGLGFGAVTGGVLGAAIGAARGAEDWQEVQPRSTPTYRMVTLERKRGIQLAFRF